MVERVLSIDPSLNCSGWALFDVNSRKLLGIGNIRGKSPKFLLADRLLDLQQKITNLYQQLSLNQNDVLISEAATTMVDPSSVLKLEQVRSMFETLARSRQARVPGRIHPRTVQKELLGMRGKQLERKEVKFAAAKVALHLYGDSFAKLGFPDDLESLQRQPDIIDAVLVGEIALARVEQARVSGMQLEEIMQEKRLNNKRVKVA